MTEQPRRAGDESYPMPLQPAAGVEPAPASAGAWLRAAREKQGLHIAVLAATIKVSTAKLEALEQDRYDALPNATFARALAQSVCRSLKIDPRPVLMLLPHADAPTLEGQVGKLNTPFQDRPGRDAAAYTLTSKPLFWAGGLLLLAAVAVYWLPPSWLEPGQQGGSSAATGSSVAPAPPASAVVAVPAPAVGQAPAIAVAAPAAASVAPPAEPVATAQAAPSFTAPPLAAASATPAAAPVPAVLPAAKPATLAAASAAPLRPGIAQLSTSAESWVEVQDGAARVLLSRTLQPGESIGVDGSLPLRLRIGNAAGTQLTFRGQPVDLAAHTRDNVARVELR